MQFYNSSTQEHNRRPSDGCQIGLCGYLRHRRMEAGFVGSFAEVLIAVAIVALVFGAIINGYVLTAIRGQWTAYSLAAQSFGMQAIEQAKSAVWDTSINKNELTNLTLINYSWSSSTQTLTGQTTNILDIPWKGTNYVMATNFITIQKMFSNMNSNVPVEIQVVRVDTVWPFTGWGKLGLRYYTNTICTIVAPDNRDPESLGGEDAAMEN